jgi:nitroreductase/NAD-dependent dihydropyrimidine dehydrogenase PreA subunit
MVIIDPQKCIGCGLCASDCFSHNLKRADGKMAVRHNCMECGHCVALCPTGAVTISDYPDEPLYDYAPAVMALDPNNLLRAMQFRRSCRDFQPRPVEREKLEMLVQAGRFTPTGSNLQDVSYFIVQDQLDAFKPMVWEGLHNITDAAARGDLAATDPTAQTYAPMWKRCYEKYCQNPADDVMFFNAPAVFIVKSELAHHSELVASRVELMAYALGLGCLFTGFVRRGITYGEAARTFLGLTGQENITCLLVGYPTHKYQRTVPRKAAQATWL